MSFLSNLFKRNQTEAPVVIKTKKSARVTPSTQYLGEAQTGVADAENNLTALQTLAKAASDKLSEVDKCKNQPDTVTLAIITNRLLHLPLAFRNYEYMVYLADPEALDKNRLSPYFLDKKNTPNVADINIFIDKKDHQDTVNDLKKLGKRDNNSNGIVGYITAGINVLKEEVATANAFYRQIPATQNILLSQLLTIHQEHAINYLLVLQNKEERVASKKSTTIHDAIDQLTDEEITSLQSFLQAQMNCVSDYLKTLDKNFKDAIPAKYDPAEFKYKYKLLNLHYINLYQVCNNIAMDRYRIKMTEKDASSILSIEDAIENNNTTNHHAETSRSNSHDSISQLMGRSEAISIPPSNNRTTGIKPKIMPTEEVKTEGRNGSLLSSQSGLTTVDFGNTLDSASLTNGDPDSLIIAIEAAIIEYNKKVSNRFFERQSKERKESITKIEEIINNVRSGNSTSIPLTSVIVNQKELLIEKMKVVIKAIERDHTHSSCNIWIPKPFTKSTLAEKLKEVVKSAENNEEFKFLPKLS